MKRRKLNLNGRKMISIALSISMLAGVFAGLTINSQAKIRPKSIYGVSNPYGKTWDTIYFGDYWQNDTNQDGIPNKQDEKEPIRWRVLSVNENEAYIMADKNLDVQPYNTELDNVNWNSSSLRTWLNSTFIDDAFSADEQAAIIDSYDDKISLLSIDDATNEDYGFTSKLYSTRTRKVLNTAYTACKDTTLTSDNRISMWWLKSDNNETTATSVSLSGHIYESGDTVHSDYVAVRPVLHIDLSKSSAWEHVGTINSDGSSKSETIDELNYDGVCGYDMTWRVQYEYNNDDYDYDDDYYYYYENCTLYISGTGKMFNFNNGHPWTYGVDEVIIDNGVKSIGNRAFCWCDLKNIVLPSSITSIGDSAFEGCELLDSITLPDSIESIGNYAFEYCDFDSITLPRSLEKIGHGIVYYCNNISSINVPDENEYFSSIDGVLFNKDVTKLVSFPIGKDITNYSVPDGVTEIATNSFAYSTLKTVDMPDSVVEMGDNAFYYCKNLEEVTFSKNLRVVGNNCFTYCKFGNITLPDGIEVIGDSAFSYCHYLKDLRLPSNITSIEYKSFYGCNSLNNVSIPNSIKKIGASAFDTATIHEYYSFYSSKDLKNLQKPKALKKINLEAVKSPFSNGSVLEPLNVSYDGSEEEWNNVHISENKRLEDAVITFNAGIYPDVTPTPITTPSPTQEATPTPTPTTPTPVFTTPATSTNPVASPTVNPSKKPVAKKKVSIKFNKKRVKLKKGKKVVLKVKVSGGSASAKVNFKFSNKKSASIVKKSKKTIVLKGKKKGRTVLKATYMGKVAKCTVIVK